MANLENKDLEVLSEEELDDVAGGRPSSSSKRAKSASKISASKVSASKKSASKISASKVSANRNKAKSANKANKLANH